MSKPIFTKQMLIDAKACPSQVDLFEKTFGDSVVVTISRAKKVAHLFQWYLAIILLDAQGQAEYNRAIDAAWAEYNRVGAPALAEYHRVIATALAELDRFTAPAWAQYKRVIIAAGAEYERVTAPAGAEYDRFTATAWATAFIDMHKRGASA